jgi:glutathione synthase/RimK-type ligase-like ATP-grasp enzyme
VTTRDCTDKPAIETLMATRQYAAARALLQELREERPGDGRIRHQLGQACFALHDIEMVGDTGAAKAAYAAASQIRPLIERRAIRTPPDFRLLALYAPFGANTPTQYLFKDASYDVDTLALFGADEIDIPAVGDVDIVVNLISDADQDEAMLFAAAQLAERFDKPVINHPAKVLRTTRDAVAGLLSDIPGCRAPRTLRLDPDTDISAAALAALLPFGLPVLVRPAGTHGGSDFEKIESFDELAHFLAQRPDADHYVIEYVDYASSDGHFRKYRFIFVGEAILPYHLAIGNGWKVHHLSTDMAHRPWMQQEEAAFLSNPGTVFNASHFLTLNAVRERIGLDYFGIDCALDSEGNIVMFEVNASMLVHDDNVQFPYKDPFVRDIKQAFEAMLRGRAGCDPASQSAIRSPRRLG